MKSLVIVQNLWEVLSKIFDVLTWWDIIGLIISPIIAGYLMIKTLKCVHKRALKEAEEHPIKGSFWSQFGMF